MLATKNQSEKFVIPGGTEGRIYPTSPNKDQSIAYVVMDGIYSKKG